MKKGQMGIVRPILVGLELASVSFDSKAPGRRGWDVHFKLPGALDSGGRRVVLEKDN